MIGININLIEGLENVKKKKRGLLDGVLQRELKEKLRAGSVDCWIVEQSARRLDYCSAAGSG